MSAILWTVIRVLALGSTLVLLPLGVGYVFFHQGEFDRGFIYLFGVCAVLALFEVVYLPFFVIGRTLSVMTAVYFVLITAAALLGFFLNSKHPKPPVERKALSKREKIFLLAAVLAAAWQIARTTFGAGTWNIDDAWYLGLANTALYTDDIMRTDPTTGFPFNYFEHMGEYLTYVFSPWPLFWAMFARLFSLTVLVLMRTVLPGFFIVLFYYVVYRLALFFFRGEREKALFALAGLSVFYELCAVAMNLRYTWMICYPWMGKAFGPSIICPLALYFFLLTENEPDAHRRRWLWIGIFLANAAGCMVASSSAEVSLMLLGCWGLVYVIRTRDWGAIWKLAFSVTPSLALMGAHFML